MEGTDLFPIIEESSPRTIKIMLTGNTQILKTLVGVDAFFGKPVSPEKLLSVIDSKLKDKAIDI